MSKKHEPGMAYDMKKLNKWFAFFSVLFLIVTFWVFLDDYLRPWKAVQIKGMQIKREKLQKQAEEAQKKVDQAKLAELELAKADATKQLDASKSEIEKVTKQLSDVRKEIKKESIRNGEYNALVAQTTFQYETANSHGKPNTKKLFDLLQKYKHLFEASNDQVKALAQNEAKLIADLEDLKSSLTTVENEIKNLTGQATLTEKAVHSTDMNFLFLLRNLPMLDFLDPTLKIQQIVVNNLTDDRYFRQIYKVDRCTTCHMFVDQPGYEDQANPYKTHPRLDVMVGTDSPHPMKKIGCTVCHGGEGHRVHDFQSIAHIPSTEEQKAEWQKKYHWHEPHKVPQEMLKLSHAEATCLKCHSGVEYVPKATVLNEGIRNIEMYGCYACHKMEGWEHRRKPGPSLKKVAAKLDKEFFKNWVWSPKSFNKHAKMPTFFNQTNNSRTDFQKSNIAEVNAIAEFVWSKSKGYTPHAKYTGGNAENGKEIISKVGCMGCHGVEGLEDDSTKVKAFAGPYLSGSGSKLKGDWLVSWLLKPSHYQEDTIMPSLRLSEKEANDIAAYLLGLKNKTFESLKFEGMDKKVRDELLLSYFSQFDTMAVAKDKLNKMSDHERTMELGSRSVGKYGCYSCHNLEGFDGRAPIGPELSFIGSKPLTQFGFSHEHVENSRSGWIQAHLLNPRRWDNGVDKPFKDLLRMPNFYMSEKEANLITTALLGRTNEVIPPQGKKQPSANDVIVANGMKVVTKYNCMGCHQIDGMGGDILKKYSDDINEGPPRLVDQGHRVQSEWLHYFLDNVHTIRPWLKVRMPSFKLSNEEKNALVAMFQAKSNQVTFVDLPEKVVWEPNEREEAHKLFKALDCTTCHTTGFTKDDPTAPDLHYAKRRLRPTWIKKWLSNPQAILEGTTMPNFWENGQSMNTEYFGGDPQKQINALSKFITEIGHNEYKGPSQSN